MIKSNEGIPGHSGYEIVEARANNDAYECECGFRTDGYHDGTSYAYFEWLKHIEEMKASSDIVTE